MKGPSFVLLLVGSTLAVAALAVEPLERGFAEPPESTKPWVYWYWISDNISREGITQDLEAMERVGIGEALIGNIFLDDVKRGTVKALSEEWWGLVEHAIREGGRLGVNIGLFNCPGWSQSGGPWIQPEQAMRYVVTTERRVRGPARFEQDLPAPKQPFQQIALLAFPAPLADADTVAARSPRVTCMPLAEDAGRMVDGDPGTVCAFPPGAGQAKEPFIVDLELAEPFTARSLTLHPAKTAFAAQCEVQVADDDGLFRRVRTFPLDRSNIEVNVGPMPHGPVAVSFPPQTAKRFRVVFTRVRNQAGLAEIELSAAARLERFVEKQLGKMHPTPLPRWDTYLWPPAAEPEAPDLAVAPGAVLDLTGQLSPEGKLGWDVPEGEWIILRLGMTPTGTKNAPASPEGQGLEVDKMNRKAAQAHFDAFIGRLLDRMPAQDRKAFKHVVADSYEMGSQNWTDGFGAVFRQRYGYDPQPWLPVLTGRLVGSADQSDRFLWDLRRLVADQIAFDYVGGLREACHAHGLKLWLENYGHWGFPAEFLQYGGQADHVSGEFWATGELGSIELRDAASAAHIYGKPVVSAEAFTSVLKFESTPWALKRRGDWALTEGINHWVLHVYIHQPWEDRRPGVNAWFSTEFNRHNTWFEPGRAWIDYYRRSQFLLQQGRHIADVAYFIGEDTPKMTGVRQPELPPGYNFDDLNAEVIQQRLSVKDGRFVLPDGMFYRLLVLPELDTMRPALLKKIRDLVAAGGTVLGPPPSRSPSLQDYPACDDHVKKLAAELWGDCDGQTVKQVRFGKGRVFRGLDLRAALETMDLSPDFAAAETAKILWTHRSSPEGEIYFVTNQDEQPALVTPVFRVTGKAPELWQADSGRIVKAAVYETVDRGIRVPLELNPRGSVFVVFREPIGGAQSVTQVTHNGEVVLTVAARPATTTETGEAKAANTFTIAGWVKPDADIDLPKEANSGVFIHLARNDAVWAAHGDSLFPEGGHACAGISAGRNGIAIYEHSANYFAPLLVQGASLAEWTHVAVVYEEAQPHLYLNGKLARQGLKSRFTVHSGMAASQVGPGGAFKGEASAFQTFGRALDETEIAGLARSKPPEAVGSRLPAITLSRTTDDGIEAVVADAGTYTLRLANGQTRSLEVTSLPAATALRGAWTLRFPANMDVPEQLMLDRLMSLTEHPDEAVKHFSGTVTYRKTFELPPSVTPDFQLHLDLGRVEAMAEVILNGRNLGVLWKPPFRLDATAAARPGANTIEVRVTGTWRNRLIGDAKYAKGFPTPDASEARRGSLQFKPFLTADIKVRPDEPLTPFGLMGPVRLQAAQRILAK